MNEPVQNVWFTFWIDKGYTDFTTRVNVYTNDVFEALDVCREAVAKKFNCQLKDVRMQCAKVFRMPKQTILIQPKGVWAHGA